MKRVEWERFSLRWPNSLRVQLQEAAQRNGRSVNAETIWRLQRSFESYRKL